MRIVIDTNVLVSSLITSDGVSKKAIDLILGSDIEICFNDEIINEYRCVLHRPVFEFNKDDIDEILYLICQQSIHVESINSPISAYDENDQCFLDAAFAGQADVLITGNKKHFPIDKNIGLQILSPSEFLDQYDN